MGVDRQHSSPEMLGGACAEGACGGTQLAELAQKLLVTFVGRPDCWARQTADGFVPVRRPLTVGDVQLHLAQQRCAGVYLVRPDQTVRCTACDWDGRHDAQWRERATALWWHLSGRGWTPILELSQSGTGAHVWILLAEPVSAAAIRRWWQRELAAAGVSCREVYPRQDSVADGGLGNLLRLPLWRASRFVAPDWTALDPTRVLDDARRHRCAELDLPDVPADAPADGSGISPRTWRLLQAEPLALRWAGRPDGLPSDQSRSGVAASLALHLARAYVPAWEIEAVLRAWGEKHGYDQAGRDDWLRRTIAAAYKYLTTGREAESAEFRTLVDCVEEYRRRSATTAAMYCSFDLPALDRAIDGVGYGELALVAARPSQGKTALAIQWAEAQARERTPVVFLSEEMSEWAIGARVWARMGHAGDPHEYFRDAAPVLVHRACHTVDRAVEVIERRALDDGARAVVVDYTQLLGSRRRRESHEEIADVSRGLKECATRLGVAILAATQLNREPDRTPGGIRLSHLGGSGQLERDADLVIALARKSCSSPIHEYAIHCMKRRNGPIREATVAARFDTQRQRFVE